MRKLIPTKVRKFSRKTFFRFKSAFSFSTYPRLKFKIQSLSIDPTLKNKMLNLLEKSDMEKLGMNFADDAFSYLNKRRLRPGFGRRKHFGCDEGFALGLTIFLLKGYVPFDPEILDNLERSFRNKKTPELKPFLSYALDFVLKNQSVIKKMDMRYCFDFVNCLMNFYYFSKTSAALAIKVIITAAENDLAKKPRNEPLLMINNQAVSSVSINLFGEILSELLKRKRTAKQKGEIGVLNNIPELVKDLFLLREFAFTMISLDKLRLTETEFNELFSALAKVNPNYVDYLGKILIEGRVA